ncbi:hypothetical protein COXBURSA331_A1671 [Coxiella burnetii RSA 331]|nr:hypothetical protein COXBURSA331_A1671 [Coxiella burnetii RSA 331]EDR35538.1 hypothetical protein COXBURSA334_0478 [Coxiella burnetii Q321]
MIIHNFNFSWLIVNPLKTNAPLLINPYTKLSFSIPPQRFKTIAWQTSQII